jgi:uncharacterized iron-regulated membrane protein
MAGKSTLNNTMRVYHRYLGFFLAGIMAVYALSGIVLIFRDTNFLKREKHIAQQLKPSLPAKALGEALRIKDLQVLSANGDTVYFKQGNYNTVTGMANYTTLSLPNAIEKLTKLHKASTKQPLYFLNIFFGVSLLFFVISSFWMFLPKTSIFKKGLYFSLAGVLLVLILLFV